jgi:predicted DNA-binding transcriptional regulator YafY
VAGGGWVGGRAVWQCAGRSDVDKFDRIFHLHAILSARRTPIPLEDLMARLECSKSTLHRTINALKDYLNAPVVFDANAGGYRYARQEQGGEAYELPGLWFTPRELQALAVMQRLLKDAGGGLLEEHLAPLARRLMELTKHQRLNLGEAASRLSWTPRPLMSPRRSWRITTQARTGFSAARRTRQRC